MRYRTALIIAFLMLLAVGVSAQPDCGFVVPCGPIPWRVPRFPRLASPTPMPTIEATNWSGNPGSGTPTPVPTATPGFLDTQAMQDQIATLNAIIAATQSPVELNGTPIDDDATYTELGQNAGTFFGYARGLTDIGLGPVGTLIGFTLLSLGIVLLVKLTTLFLPLVVALFGLIRKLFHIIMEFLPL